MALQDVCGFQDTPVYPRWNTPASLFMPAGDASLHFGGGIGCVGSRLTGRDFPLQLYMPVPDYLTRSPLEFGQARPNNAPSKPSPSGLPSALASLPPLSPLSPHLSVPLPFPLSHGTTTLAFAFRGGVVAAADTRSSCSGLVACPASQKVEPVHPHLVATTSGTSADCALWKRVLARELRLRRLQHRRGLTTGGAAKLLALMLHPFKGTELCVATTLCGWDLGQEEEEEEEEEEGGADSQAKETGEEAREGGGTEGEEATKETGEGQQRAAECTDTVQSSRGQQRAAECTDTVQSSRGQQRAAECTDTVQSSRGQQRAAAGCTDTVQSSRGQQRAAAGCTDTVQSSRGQQRAAAGCTDTVQSSRGQQRAAAGSTDTVQSSRGQQRAAAGSTDTVQSSRGQQRAAGCTDTVQSSRGQQRAAGSTDTVQSSRGQLNAAGSTDTVQSSRGQQNAAAGSGPSLYYVCSDGTRLQGELFSVGSGSPYAYSVLDGGVRWGMGVAEAFRLAREAVYRATHRDAYSGNCVDLFHITASGWRRREREDLKEEYYREREKVEERRRERERGGKDREEEGE